MDAETSSSKFFLRPGPQGLAIDAILAGGMFLLFFAIILPPHIPVYDPLWKGLLSAYTATVMAGFFFLFFALFRATIVDQLSRKEVKGDEKWLKAARLLRYIK
ncbi:MAG: hypothetical protein ACFB21_16720 [Opitutales bacterium]